MVDEFDILSLLMPDKASDEAIAGSDPYLAIKQAPDLVSQVLLKESANPRHSLKDKVIAGLLTGVTGGALGGLSSNYQTRAKSAYQDALFGKGQADVLDDDIFAMADQKRKQASIFNKLLEEQKQEEVDTELIKLRNKSGQELTDKAIDQAFFGKTELERERGFNLLNQLNEKKEVLVAPGKQVEEGGVRLDTSADSEPLGNNLVAVQVKEADPLAELIDLETDTEYRAIENRFGPESAQKYIDKKIAEKSEDKKDWFYKLPAQAQNKLNASGSTIVALRDIAQEFSALKDSRGEFAVKQYFSGTGANSALSKLKLNLGNIVRLSGDVGNIAEQEQARQLEATIGNWTSNSDEAAARIKEAAALHSKLAIRQLKNAKLVAEQGGDALITQLEEEAASGDSASDIQTRKLKDGRTVRVRPLGNGKWEMVP